MKTASSRWERGAMIAALCCFSGILFQPAGRVNGTNPPSEAPAQAPTEAVGAVTEAPPSSIPPIRESTEANRSENVLGKVREALLQEDFTYPETNLPDPFLPFISAAEPPPPQAAGSGESETDLPPEQQRPLTPLQKMTLAEIDKGLRAITWGDLGRKAVIEDAAGKGYIVEVGTPVGDKNGVVTQIFNDRLVIQQQVWDRQARKMVAVNSVVKLKKQP